MLYCASPISQRFFTTPHASPVRIENRGDGSVSIVGYAAVFYHADNPLTEYRVYSDLAERILPGAFDRALREKQDVRALFNHNADALLGTISAGTLSLSVDSRGLQYRITPPNTQLAQDVISSIRRGDLKGSSFAFSIPKGGEAWTEDKGSAVRLVSDVNLFDVGPVTYPAYGASTTGLA